MFLVFVTFDQTTGSGHVCRYRRARQRSMGAGSLSSGQLGLLLLQHLERRPIIWQGQRSLQNRFLLLLCFTNQIIRWTQGFKYRTISNPCLCVGSLLHRHVPIRDAVDPPHQRPDSTRSVGRSRLLPVSRGGEAGQP